MWPLVGLSLLALVLLAPLAGSSLAAPEIRLPPPAKKGSLSLEAALAGRRSQRGFARKALTLPQLGQLLWAAYGITRPPFYKTVPSAGALYPLDVYVVAGAKGVEGLAEGVYHYSPQGHALKRLKSGDQREALARHSWAQMWMARAPVMLVITAEYSRATGKYGQRGVVYSHIEAGCAGQNIFLQSQALGLGAGIVGAFANHLVQEALGVPELHQPLLIMPVGHPD